MHRLVRCLCCRHRHCHQAGKQGTSDDAKASLSTLLLPLTCTSVRCCRCHCHRVGKQGTGDDAEASSSALSPSSLRYVVCSAAIIAIARASKGQVMMPRHHRLPCRCRQRTRASAAAIAITRASEGRQVMMPQHHRLPCCRCRREQGSALPLPPPSRR